MPLSITADGTQTITDATGSSGVVYLSGGLNGATVTLGVKMSNLEVVELDGSALKKGSNVVQHGTGVTLVAVTRGSGGASTLTLDYYPL